MTCSCGDIHQQYPVRLEPADVVPVLNTAKATLRNPSQITIVKPLDQRSSQEIAYTIQGPYRDSYVVEQDVGAWLGDGIAAVLENAGYTVRSVDGANEAKTPLVLTAELTKMKTSLGGPPIIALGFISTISTRSLCLCKLKANIRLAKNGTVLLDRNYSGEGESRDLCQHPDLMAAGMRKALESILAQMAPDFGNAIASST